MIKKILLALTLLFSSTIINAEVTPKAEIQLMKKVKKLFEEEAVSSQVIYSKKMVKRGQKIFKKKLQRVCGFTAAYFAQRHTQDEWIEYYEKDKFMDEFKNLCPNGVEAVKNNWVKPLYFFSKEYAKDKPNRPIC